MKIALALTFLLAAACSTHPCTRGEAANERIAYVFIDDDDDGLPDRHAPGFGFTSLGVSTFADTDDDGLPDTRLVPTKPSRTDRIDRALSTLEQAIAELRRELQRR